MTKETIETKISAFLKQYFQLLDVEVDFDIEESDEVYMINLKTGGDLSGLLIGAKGKNIYSFQRLLNIVFNKEELSKSIVVNIDDWRQKEEDRLNDLAQKTADHVKQSGQAQNLYNLSASQRKVIHTYLSQVDGIKTESQGEGEQRYLTVSVK